MANNTLLASDNFASGSLAAGWSAISSLSTCQVVAGTPNVTEPNATANLAGQIWTGLSWPKDQASEVTINNLTSGDVAGASAIRVWVRLNFATNAGYKAQLESNATTSCRLRVFKSDGTTDTQLGLTITGLAVSAGSVLVLQVAGSNLAVYLNGVRVFYIGDATYTSGSPAYGQMAATNVNHSQVSSWRGYSAVQQDGIWTKQGVILSPVATELANSNVGSGVTGFEGVRYEGNAQILSGNVYKGYFVNLNGVNYAESSDGLTWVRYSGNPVISGYSGVDVFKYNGTYYLWSQTVAAIGSGAAYMFTSADGVNWSAGTLTNLAAGSGGQWDNPTVYFGLHVFDVIGGVFYGLYSALNGTNSAPSTGLATSSDGVTWTKYAGNPILTGVFCGTQIVKINGKYYAWMNANQPGQGNATASGFDPLESVLYSSSDGINWSFVHHSIHASGMWESLNSTEAGVFTTAVIQIGNRVGMYYEGSPGDSTGPQVYQGGLALAPIGSTLAQVVVGNEDGTVQLASDGFTNGTGNLSSSWTTPSWVGSNPLQIVAGNLVEGTVASVLNVALYTGASFGANQYSEITVAKIANGNCNLYPVVRGNLAAKTQYIASIQLTGTMESVVIYRQVAGVTTQISTTGMSTSQIGDVFRLSVVNGPAGQAIVTLYQNGFTVCTCEDWTPITSGLPGMIAAPDTTLSNAQISKWAGGNTNVIPGYSSASASWLTIALDNSLRGLKH